MLSNRAQGKSVGHFAFSPAGIMLLCAIALTTLGLTILFSATASYRQGAYFYLAKQIMGVTLSGVLLVIASRINLECLRKYVWYIAGFTLLTLVLVLIPGIGVSVKGSSRWLGLGPIRFQVSELGKLAAIFCLSHYLALNQSRIEEFKKGFVMPLAIIGTFAGLIFLEPDFGTTALVVAVGLVLMFLAGARWRYILPSIGMFVGMFTVAVLLNPNRLYRFLAFLDVEKNKNEGSYQLYQSILAFAAGGTGGVGLGQGRQQLNFLPEAHTDFIFPVVGEELGLWFTLGTVCVFLIMFLAGIWHLRKAPNLFQFLLATGCVLLISLQAIVNLGVVTGILPTKGMSLPFISAGLSNLMLMGVLLGIIINTQRTWAQSGLRQTDRTMQEVFA